MLPHLNWTSFFSLSWNIPMEFFFKIGNEQFLIHPHSSPKSWSVLPVLLCKEDFVCKSIFITKVKFTGQNISFTLKCIQAADYRYSASIWTHLLNLKIERLFFGRYQAGIEFVCLCFRLRINSRWQESRRSWYVTPSWMVVPPCTKHLPGRSCYRCGRGGLRLNHRRCAHRGYPGFGRNGRW